MGLSDNHRLNFDAFLQQMHPYDREANQQVVQNGLRNQKDFDLEYRAMTSNSEIRWIKARGRVELDPSGKPLHLRGVSLDITARKKYRSGIAGTLPRAGTCDTCINPGAALFGAGA
jgi:PAS domain-containing protein